MWTNNWPALVREIRGTNPAPKASFLMLDTGLRRERVEKGREAFQSPSQEEGCGGGEETPWSTEKPHGGELPGARVVWQEGEAACHRSQLLSVSSSEERIPAHGAS